MLHRVESIATDFWYVQTAGTYVLCKVQTSFTFAGSVDFISLPVLINTKAFIPILSLILFLS